MNVVTLSLDDVAFGGDAIGHSEGKAVFVPLGIPGETVRVEIVENRPKYAHGRLLEVLSASPHRVQPPCPYYGLCGGCQWQHIDYAEQLRLKQSTVSSQLGRIGRVASPNVRPTLGMETPWEYRNHVQLKADRRGQIGYYALKSHDVVPVDRCPISHPLIEDLWDALDIEFGGLEEIALRAGSATGDQMVIFRGSEQQPPELSADLPISCLYQSDPSNVTVLAGKGYLTESLLGRPFQVSGPSFFQVNTPQAERLVELVSEGLALQPDDRLLDAYCGVGTFALSLAGQCAAVLGIENSTFAVQDAVENRHEGEEVDLVEGDVAEALQELEPLWTRSSSTRRAPDALPMCLRRSPTAGHSASSMYPAMWRRWPVTCRGLGFSATSSRTYSRSTCSRRLTTSSRLPY